MRYTVIALAVAVNMVSYLDRVSISVAAPALRTEFGFTPLQMGQVFSAFSLSYAIFQAPWGAAADRFGARAIVSLGIIGWSLFTGLTAAAWNLVSLLAIRFVFGAIEACLSPAVSSAFGRWIPAERRSTAFGIFLGGGRLGGAIGPGVAALLVLHYGWRSSFVAFAGLGIVAGAMWWRFYRDPSEVARAPRASGPTPVSASLVFLLLAAFSYTCMWQFYITWFPTYLVEKRGFTLLDAGKLAGLPFLFGLGANWIGGFASDGLVDYFRAAARDGCFVRQPDGGRNSDRACRRRGRLDARSGLGFRGGYRRQGRRRGFRPHELGVQFWRVCVADCVWLGAPDVEGVECGSVCGRAGQCAGSVFLVGGEGGRHGLRLFSTP